MKLLIITTLAAAVGSTWAGERDLRPVPIEVISIHEHVPHVPALPVVELPQVRVLTDAVSSGTHLFNSNIPATINQIGSVGGSTLHSLHGIGSTVPGLTPPPIPSIPLGTLSAPRVR